MQSVAVMAGKQLTYTKTHSRTKGEILFHNESIKREIMIKTTKIIGTKNNYEQQQARLIAEAAKRKRTNKM